MTITNHEEREMKDILSVFTMGSFFILIYGLALLVIKPFEDAGLSAFENPNDPWNVIYLILTLIIFTAVILLISKFKKKRLVQGIILGSTGYLVFYTLYPILTIVIPELWAICVSMITAAIAIIMLIKYPEWYVVDICGILVGTGAIATLGISLNIFLVILFLIGLAIYDAISVYKTKHMINLADIVLDLKLPVILVIPKVKKYSLIKETKGLREKLEAGEEREAFVMGLGDIVIPGILVASTFYNIPDKGFFIALSVMLGILLGFTVLLMFLVKGKPQAGLPYLCSGAILGYLISSYILFKGFIGLTF
jgi:presenilin-like A22 family membrane protease